MGRIHFLSIAVLVLVSLLSVKPVTRVGAVSASGPSAHGSGGRTPPGHQFAGWTKLKQGLVQTLDPKKGSTGYRDGANKMSPNRGVRLDVARDPRRKTPSEMRGQIKGMKGERPQGSSSMGIVDCIAAGLAGAMIGIGYLSALKVTLNATLEARKEHLAALAARPIAKEQLRLTIALRVLVEKMTELLSWIITLCLLKLIVAVFRPRRPMTMN
jgi:hypothetical protein